MTIPARRLAVALATMSIALTGVTAACGTNGPTGAASADVATPTPSLAPADSPSPTVSPTPAATATPAPPASVAPTPLSTPTHRSTAAPSARPPSPAAPSTTDAFWDRVARGIRDARRLEVEVDGPTPGTLRFEATASATVIEGVVGFVCLGGRAYDGQSAFTQLPGSWTCGGAALVAGFRHIGQPIDAWNATVPSDDARRESVSGAGATLTWHYRATSPYYGGRVTATVTIDTSTRRITAAAREDPTGVTTYTFRYGADFPPIAVPR